MKKATNKVLSRAVMLVLIISACGACTKATTPMNARVLPTKDISTGQYTFNTPQSFSIPPMDELIEFSCSKDEQGRMYSSDVVYLSVENSYLYYEMNGERIDVCLDYPYIDDHVYMYGILNDD